MCDEQIVLSGIATHGTFTTDYTACNDGRPLVYVCFKIVVENCTGCAINNAKVRLNLKNSFMMRGGVSCSPNPNTVKVSITSSIGQPNVAYDGVDSNSLLCTGTTFPPGCSTFVVCMQDRELENPVQILGATATFSGRLGCANNNNQKAPVCHTVLKTCTVASDCLPFLEDIGGNPTSNVIYVRETSSGGTNEDGSSWFNAYVGANGLKTALLDAQNRGGAQIWVQLGTYDAGLQRYDVDGDNIELYGGFQGTECAICQRNIDRVVVTGSAASLTQLTVANNVSIEVMNITGSNGLLDGFRVLVAQENGVQVRDDAVNVTLRHLHVTPQAGVTMVSGITFSRGSSTYLCDVFTEGLASGQHVSPGDGDLTVFGNGVRVKDATGNPFTSGIITSIGNEMEFHNILVENCTTGIAAGGRIKLVNATVTKNDLGVAAGLNVIDPGLGLADVTMINSILQGNAADIGQPFAPDANDVICLRDTIFGNIIAPQYTGTLKQIRVKMVDPLFVDFANDDFHLSARSPAIQCGDNSAVTTMQDLDGNVRIVRNRVDVGSYEDQTCVRKRQ